MLFAMIFGADNIVRRCFCNDFVCEDLYCEDLIEDVNREDVLFATKFLRRSFLRRLVLGVCFCATNFSSRWCICWEVLVLAKMTLQRALLFAKIGLRRVCENWFALPSFFFNCEDVVLPRCFCEYVLRRCSLEDFVAEIYVAKKFCEYLFGCFFVKILFAKMFFSLRFRLQRFVCECVFFLARM